jgi:DNA helicase-2/ATP-dependent DNA helicase PcrA
VNYRQSSKRFKFAKRTVSQLLTAAYSELSALVSSVSPRSLRPAHHSHTKRLALVGERLAYTGQPVPGLTTHQAKGGEWRTVGVRLKDEERAALARGLTVDRDTDRKLYVACARAQYATVELLADGVENSPRRAKGSIP